ncbi:MAG TPA: AI-2E family transporter [Caulobacteraceae bacterium]|jgi:predicted PurR-regulated permease PerM|nr:AI-2E family transporter [Caulobacteraceae bacterium]
MGPDRTADVARNAQVFSATVLAFVALRWLGAILTPLLLAVFLGVMVDGFARFLRRRLPDLPEAAALTGAIIISAALFVGGVLVLVEQAGGFVSALAGAQPKLNRLLREAAGLMHMKRPGSVNQLLTSLNPSSWLGTVAAALQNLLSSALLVLIYLGFLVAARVSMSRKVVRLFGDRRRRRDAVRLLLRVRHSIERYLWIQTVTGLMIAGASWLVMALVGLDNALFWALLIFLVNYVPIVGAAAAIVLPAVFAAVQFPGLGQAAIILGGLFIVTFIVGNIVLPRMQGDSLNMDPLVVLLSLAFWGALWGLAGMFLSTPLTVLAMMILAQIPGARWIAVLLSANGAPERLLQDEPRRRARAARVSGVRATRPA